MKRSMTSFFGEIANILGVCPCCGELFYLSETRPYLQGRRAHSIVDGLRGENRKLDRAEEALREAEQALREKAAQQGLRTAKKLLKKIDPVFSGSGYDPKDVKVIFDPVTYVVFDGMSDDRLKQISLLAKAPDNVHSERIQKSIGKAIKSGNIEFRTLHVDETGAVTSQ